MQYRQLGSTGLEVSEIGFGTWGLGGDSYGPVDDETSKKSLRLAFELGVTFYDTSDLYGNGHSEEILGEALKEVRQKIVIATKVGTLPHSGFNMPQEFSVQHIRESLEGSLRRLKTDYVDLYQLHSPSIETLVQNQEIIPTLEALQQEGKIREYGISARSPHDALTAIEKHGLKVVQINFNLIDQRALDDGLFTLSQQKCIGIIVRTPLSFGYLSGHLSGDESFLGHDHRTNWPQEQLRRWANSPKLFAPLYEGTDRTLVQLALKFCLSQDSVSTVIPGMMTCNQVTEDVKASEMQPLTITEIGTIRGIYDQNTFYDPSIKEGAHGTGPPVD